MRFKVLKIARTPCKLGRDTFEEYSTDVLENETQDRSGVNKVKKIVKTSSRLIDDYGSTNSQPVLYVMTRKDGKTVASGFSQ